MTVLFCDMRKYTEITQHMSPEEAVLMLNEHMTAMTRVVHEHDGLVDKFVGDMIMAVLEQQVVIRLRRSGLWRVPGR